MPYLKTELVRVEKRAMPIICPELPYEKAIELVNIVPIVHFITGISSRFLLFFIVLLKLVFDPSVGEALS